MSTTSGARGGRNNESYKLPRLKDEEVLEQPRESRRSANRGGRERENQQASREMMDKAGRDSKERRPGGGGAIT